MHPLYLVDPMTATIYQRKSWVSFMQEILNNVVGAFFILKENITNVKLYSVRLYTFNVSLQSTGFPHSLEKYGI